MGFWKELFSIPEEEEEIETYKIDCLCMNCREEQEVNIEVGKLVKQELEKFSCVTCKIKYLVQISDPFKQKDGRIFETVAAILNENISEKQRKKILGDGTKTS